MFVGVNKSDRHCRLLLLQEIKFHPYLHFSKMNCKWVYPERDKVNSKIHMLQSLVSNQKSFQNKILEGGGEYSIFIY